MPTTINVNEAGYDLDVGGATGSIVSGTLQLSGVANIAGLATFTGGTYRRIQIGDGTAGNGYDGIRFTDMYGSFWVGISAGYFRITSGLYSNSTLVLSGGTAAGGASLHTSDSTNLYGTGKFNSEVAVGVSFPAIHVLMRGTPSGTERAIKVTNGPTYTTEVFTVDFNGNITAGNLSATSFMQLVEMTAPVAPSANGVRIFAEDNGSGKTRLMARFATGSAVQIAIEP